jgi:hypothetical protein
MSDEPTVTIDGQTYTLSSLSEAAKGQVSNLRLVEQEIARLQTQLGIAQTARNAYAQALKAELPSGNQ